LLRNPQPNKFSFIQSFQAPASAQPADKAYANDEGFIQTSPVSLSLYGLTCPRYGFRKPQFLLDLSRVYADMTLEARTNCSQKKGRQK